MDRLCEVQVSYRPKYENASHPKIRTSTDASKLKWQIFSDDTIDYCEIFAVVFLNRAARIIGISKMFAGGTGCVMVDPKMIIQQALLTNAHAIILTHNHPSGECSPSSEDDKITRKIVDGASYFDIRVVDHIIMSRDNYFSYADNGKI